MKKIIVAVAAIALVAFTYYMWILFKGDPVQMTERTQSTIQNEGKFEAVGQKLSISACPNLEFRAMLPEGLEWFEDDSPVNAFNPSGMFSTFRRTWLGYNPTERDRLEIAIYCATIPSERVAVAGDYARLLAMVWGPKNFGTDFKARDFGEVITGADKDGVSRRERINIWRRGTDLLIIRATTNDKDLITYTPTLDTMIGSLEFLNEVKDSIISNLVDHSLRLQSGKDFKFALPSHWQAWDDSKVSSAPISAAVYLDKADKGGNSAIGIFGVAVPDGEKSKQAPLREIASAMSDVLLKNLAPGIEFKRESISQNSITGFDKLPAQGLFLDKLSSSKRPPMGATGFFVALPKDVAGFSDLSAYPSDQEAMGLMMHANFVQRLVVDQMREQFGTVADNPDPGKTEIAMDIALTNGKVDVRVDGVPFFGPGQTLEAQASIIASLPANTTLGPGKNNVILRFWPSNKEPGNEPSLKIRFGYTPAGAFPDAFSDRPYVIETKIIRDKSGPLGFRLDQSSVGQSLMTGQITSKLNRTPNGGFEVMLRLDVQVALPTQKWKSGQTIKDDTTTRDQVVSLMRKAHNAFEAGPAQILKELRPMLDRSAATIGINAQELLEKEFSIFIDPSLGLSLQPFDATKSRLMILGNGRLVTLSPSPVIFSDKKSGGSGSPFLAYWRDSSGKWQIIH